MHILKVLLDFGKIRILTGRRRIPEPTQVVRLTEMYLVKILMFKADDVVVITTLLC